MKKLIYLLITLMLILSCSKKEEKTTRHIAFNDNWLFIEDSTLREPELSHLDVSEWSIVNLPHDWSVSDYEVQDSVHFGPFYTNMPKGHNVGYLRGGTGWYKKEFTLPKDDPENHVYIHFDGVQTEMELWVNGKEAGTHVYGYTPFYFNITPFLNDPGKKNTITAKVVNPGNNSRWFAGAGIYRSVSLSVVNPLHTDVWGVFVKTKSINKEEALMNIEVDINNFTDDTPDIKVKVSIIAPNKNVVASTDQIVSIPSGDKKTVEFNMPVPSPQSWDINSPSLYKANILLYQDKKLIDQYVQSFGIRSIEFSADKGFLLNGRPVLLKGGCMHHDNGLLGAAAFKRAEYRRVEIMKKNGYNAIRTAHNPPSEYFLDACDKMGVLVIDESFDMWIKPKNPNDYSNFYEDWWKKDTKEMVMRDRNHPSIIMWSIGNEIKERADSSGLAIAKAAYNFIKSIDPTRPVTQAVNGFWDNPGKVWDDTAPVFAQMDVGGYNYQFKKYVPDHAKYPERIMYGSESMPLQAYQNWSMVEKYPNVIGDFVWTSMDYIGEATLARSEYRDSPNAKMTFHKTFPYYIANSGDIDIVGNKKAPSYYRDVLWGESKLEMAVLHPIPEGKHELIYYWGWPNEYQSWNWQGHESDSLWVNVYSSYPEVRMELNGKVIGQKKIMLSDQIEDPYIILLEDNITGYRTAFHVPYESGELKLIGLEDGKEMEYKTLKTTGKPYTLKLQAEHTAGRAGTDEIVYINVTATDQEGNRIPLYSSDVEVSVSGPGQLIGAGNGGIFAEGSLQDHQFKLFNGRGLIIVRSNGKKGTITVSARSENLIQDDVIIQMKGPVASACAKCDSIL